MPDTIGGAGTRIKFVPKKLCSAFKSCPDAGRPYHRAHGTCLMWNCLDRGIQHWGDHRVREARRVATPDGTSTEAGE